MKRYILLVLLLVSVVGYTQNGINYKALIKDDLGNAIVNASVDIKFKILESDAQTNIYEEIHSPSTDDNGIIIVNIGEGTIISGIFDEIKWGDDNHYLNVQIDSGSGFISLGTVQFSAVPYALHAKKAANVKGLEAIDEGNGIGWRLVDRPEVFYGNIGENAVDFSFSNSGLIDKGALGLNSFATGFFTEATGDYTTSMGYNTEAAGDYSTSLGFNTEALGDYSLASGRNSSASGDNSIALGHLSIASSSYAISMGTETEASGNSSIALGNNTTASNEYAVAIGQNTTASGANSTAFGRNTEATGANSVAMGSGTEAQGNFSFAFGDSSEAQGNNSIAMGDDAFATNDYAVAIGRDTFASGQSAFSTGSNTDATGNYSVATGQNTTASSTNSTAMGLETEASGPRSTAMGYDTEASGINATATGGNTIASGLNAIATGFNTEASGFHTTAMGYRTTAASYASTAIGRHNIGGGSSTTWQPLDPLFEIGNGSNASNRSNALTVYKNGQHTINADYIGLVIPNPSYGIIIDEPSLIGINITNANNIGIAVTSDYRGGYFLGEDTGVFATSSNSSNPDIILGGSSGSNDNDDGIIASDYRYSGSDIYLRSNDAVVIQLDHDNFGSIVNTSSFFIRDGENNNVFSVNENGVVRINNSVIHNSDRRLKTSIENLDYGLKEILQLQPKQYFWKNQEKQKKSLGLIAQDVQTIIGEIVTCKDDELKTLGVSYTELIPVLINAIKEQNRLIENQKKDIYLLKSEFSSIKNLLTELKITEQ